MAILTSDEFTQRLKDRFGTSESEEDIAFMEDITDTVEDLRSKQNSDGYKEKYEALRTKYRDRFFGKSTEPDEEDREDERDVNKLTFESLFTNK